MLTKAEIMGAVCAPLSKRQRSTLWHALKHFQGRLEGAPHQCALIALRAERTALARLQVRVAMGESAYNPRKLAQRLGAVESTIERLERESS